MNVVEIINEAIASGRTRFAFELLPPLKGDGMQKIFAAVEPLMALDPAYVNITFHREGIKETEREDGSVEWHVVRRRPGTVGISAAIQNRYGVEVVPHLICGGLSKYDIEDTLIDMDFLGLHNVLALRGDKSQNEKRFMPHPQGHAHAVDLVRQIADMNRGKFIDGEVEECHHSKFSIGVAGYPEEIEDKLNNMYLVLESLVLDAGNGKIKALVVPDYEQAEAEGVDKADLPQIMQNNLQELNAQLAAYERISGIALYPNEFEKTPKRSIKRYLYEPSLLNK